MIPEQVTFEQALDLSQALLATSLSEAELESTISALVQSDNGARGFFVTFLAGDSPLADQPSPAVLAALHAAPKRVAGLLTRNLAMSTAMILTHQRNGDPTQAAGSARVQRRTQALIRQLELPELQAELADLASSIEQGQGSYRSFLERWGYDAEQRQAIGQILAQ